MVLMWGVSHIDDAKDLLLITTMSFSSSNFSHVKAKYFSPAFGMMTLRHPFLNYTRKIFTATLLDPIVS